LGLTSLALGLLAFAGQAGLGEIVVLALLFGTFSAVDNPARQAFVGEVVGRDKLRDAVTFHGTATTYSWLIGSLGLGAVIGGLYAARSAHRPEPAHLVRCRLRGDRGAGCRSPRG
jgi:MFS family permease